MTGRKRILIVDDHALARAGFAGLLRESEVAADVIECADADTAQSTLRQRAVDLVILDLSLPGRSGLDLLRHLRVSSCGVPVLVLSGFPEQQYAINVLRAGARGYLSKSCAPDELVRAVRTLLEGRRYISGESANLLVGEALGGQCMPRHSQLSEREFDIFLKLAGGQGTTEVATNLYLSPKTVSTYRSRILEKLAMHTNADLTRYALDNRLIE